MTREEEDAILAQAEAIEIARVDALAERSKAVDAKLKAGEPFHDDELVYAAFSRCVCGAGYAYPKDIGPHGYWECADVLTGRSPRPSPDEPSAHSGVMPFVFWSVKSELQPSAQGATTRQRPAAWPEGSE